jgi:hypothetical protein
MHCPLYALVSQAIASLKSIQICFSQISHLPHTNKSLPYRMFLHFAFSAPSQLLCVAVDLHPSDRQVNAYV